MPDADPAPNPNRILAYVIGVLVLIIAVIVACTPRDDSAGESNSSSQYTSGSNSSSTQVDFTSMTCQDWSAMTPAQRSAAASRMLTNLRNNGDGGSGSAPASLAALFRSDVTEGCDTGIEGQNLAETAASIYLIGRDTYQP